MTDKPAIPPARLRYIGSVPQSLVSNRVVQLNKDVVSFGRDKNKVDVFLDSSRVPRMISRVHAIMRVQDNKWVLNDNRSVNGAYINGQLVKGNIAVSHGDTVVFGRHYPESEFVYRFEEGEESDQPPIIPADEPESLIVSVDTTAAPASTGFASAAAAPSITSSPSQSSVSSAPIPPTITPINPAPAPATTAASTAKEKESGGKLGSELEEEFTCSICQSLIARASTLPCSHSFCSECITHWLGRKRTCPSCREAATLMNLVPSRVLDNAIDRIKHLVLDEEDLEDHKDRVKAWDERPPAAAAAPGQGGGGRGGRSTLNVLGNHALQAMYMQQAGRARGRGAANLPPPPPRMPPPPPGGSNSPRPPPPGGFPGMMQGLQNMSFSGGQPGMPPNMPAGMGMPPQGMMPPRPGMPGRGAPPGRGGMMMPGMQQGMPGRTNSMTQQFSGGQLPPNFNPQQLFRQMGGNQMNQMPPPGMPFNMPAQTTNPGQFPGTQTPPTGGGQLESSRVLFARGPAFQQRQACRLCGVQVTQGTLCVQGTFAGGVESYYHVPCFCLDESVPRVERPSDFPGYSELDATERAAFETLLVQGIRERMEKEGNGPRQ